LKEKSNGVPSGDVNCLGKSSYEDNLFDVFISFNIILIDYIIVLIVNKLLFVNEFFIITKAIISLQTFVSKILIYKLSN